MNETLEKLLLLEKQVNKLFGYAHNYTPIASEVRTDVLVLKQEIDSTIRKLKGTLR